MEIDDCTWLKILCYAIDEDWNNYIPLYQVSKRIARLIKMVTMGFSSMNPTDSPITEDEVLAELIESLSIVPEGFLKWRPFDYPLVVDTGKDNHRNSCFFEKKIQGCDKPKLFFKRPWAFKRCVATLDLYRTDNLYFAGDRDRVECLECIRFYQFLRMWK